MEDNYRANTQLETPGNKTKQTTTKLFNKSIPPGFTNTNIYIVIKL